MFLHCSCGGREVAFPEFLKLAFLSVKCECGICSKWDCVLYYRFAVQSVSKMEKFRGAPSCKILVAHSENENICRWFRLIFWLIFIDENHPKPPQLSIYDQIEVDKKSIWSDKFILCGMVKFGKQYFSSLFFYFPIKYIISDYDKLISPIFL